VKNDGEFDALQMNGPMMACQLNTCWVCSTVWYHLPSVALINGLVGLVTIGTYSDGKVHP